MDSLLHYLPLMIFFLNLIFGYINTTYTIKKDRREAEKERVERLQLESTQKENGAYPRRKDKHRKR